MKTEELVVKFKKKADNFSQLEPDEITEKHFSHLLKGFKGIQACIPRNRSQFGEILISWMSTTVQVFSKVPVIGNNVLPWFTNQFIKLCTVKIGYTFQKEFYSKWLDLIKNANDEALLKSCNSNLEIFESVTQLLKNCGDLSCQNFILDIFGNAGYLKPLSKDQRINVLQTVFNQAELLSYLENMCDNFQYEDRRKFLMKFNEVHAVATVFTAVTSCIRIGDHNFSNHNFYLDFNHSSKSMDIQMYIHCSDTVDEKEWVTLSTSADNLTDLDVKLIQNEKWSFTGKLLKPFECSQPIIYSKLESERKFSIFLDEEFNADFIKNHIIPKYNKYKNMVSNMGSQFKKVTEFNKKWGVAKNESSIDRSFSVITDSPKSRAHSVSEFSFESRVEETSENVSSRQSPASKFAAANSDLSVELPCQSHQMEPLKGNIIETVVVQPDAESASVNEKFSKPESEDNLIQALTDTTSTLDTSLLEHEFKVPAPVQTKKCKANKPGVKKQTENKTSNISDAFDELKMSEDVNKKVQPVKPVPQATKKYSKAKNVRPSTSSQNNDERGHLYLRSTQTVITPKVPRNIKRISYLYKNSVKKLLTSNPDDVYNPSREFNTFETEITEVRTTKRISPKNPQVKKSVQNQAGTSTKSRMVKSPKPSTSKQTQLQFSDPSDQSIHRMLTDDFDISSLSFEESGRNKRSPIFNKRKNQFDEPGNSKVNIRKKLAMPLNENLASKTKQNDVPKAATSETEDDFDKFMSAMNSNDFAQNSTPNATASKFSSNGLNRPGIQKQSKNIHTLNKFLETIGDKRSNPEEENNDEIDLRDDTPVTSAPPPNNNLLKKAEDIEANIDQPISMTTVDQIDSGVQTTPEIKSVASPNESKNTGRKRRISFDDGNESKKLRLFAESCKRSDFCEKTELNMIGQTIEHFKARINDTLSAFVPRVKSFETQQELRQNKINGLNSEIDELSVEIKRLEAEVAKKTRERDRLKSEQQKENNSFSVSVENIASFIDSCEEKMSVLKQVS